MNDWKSRLGMVYSTNDNFEYEQEPTEQIETKERAKQALRIFLDKKQRGGKQVTIVGNFSGTEEDLKTLGKLLKTKCGVGGSTKEGEIIIQGDFREKILTLLKNEGYIKARVI